MRGRANGTTEDQFAAMLAYYQDQHTLRETADAFSVGYGFLYKSFSVREWVRPRGFRIKPTLVSTFDDAALVAFKAQ